MVAVAVAARGLPILSVAVPYRLKVVGLRIMGTDIIVVAVVVAAVAVEGWSNAHQQSRL